MFISKTQLKDILLNAIQNKDRKVILENFVKAKNIGIDKSILDEAKLLIKELPEEKEPEVEKTLNPC